MKAIKWLSFSLLFFPILFGCKGGGFSLIKPATPHEQYGRKLINAGLNQSAVGSTWLNVAQRSLQNALPITLPYQERGYFAADKVEAVVLKFKLTRGQKINIQLSKNPNVGFMIYLDLLAHREDGQFRSLAAADTLGNTLAMDVNQTGEYILRLQPELLQGGSYHLVIQVGPSLGIPVKAMNRKQIQSFYGDGRDENTRKHEGVDIFAPFRTPAIATNSGMVTAVNNNNLGGKVVWFRPEGKDFTLYYAHLDEQKVSAGQNVLSGDTLGLIGNTGNAKTTLPHLHFGIYTANGAIDPLPFIDPLTYNLPKITIPEEKLNATMRTTKTLTLNGTTFSSGTIVRVISAAANQYRVVFPDGFQNYIAGSALSVTTKPLSKFKLTTDEELLDSPWPEAPVKRQLGIGENLAILGNFRTYNLVMTSNEEIGWLKK